MGLTSSGGVTVNASYKPERHRVQSFPSHVITTPNGPCGCDWVHLYGTHSVDIDGELAKLDADGYRPLRPAVTVPG